jgi:hypothetical protein
MSGSSTMHIHVFQMFGRNVVQFGKILDLRRIANYGLRSRNVRISTVRTSFLFFQGTPRRVYSAGRGTQRSVYTPCGGTPWGICGTRRVVHATAGTKGCARYCGYPKGRARYCGYPKGRARYCGYPKGRARYCGYPAARRA